MNQITPRTLLLPPIVTQTVTIPADAYVELSTDGGPHLAVYARPTDTTPIIRIRIGPGTAEDRQETTEMLIDAARELGGAL